jgi:glycosyltransferase involved in cell wall biosynthesis
MISPKITVLMAVYNGSRFLHDSIRSIINQTFNDFEFLIVNDGSTDDSLSIIKSFHDSRIRVISNVENIGLTKSLNIGLKASRGTYIARMDADDISLSDRLALQYKYLNANPNITLLGGGAHFIDENNRVRKTKLRLLDHYSIFFFCFFNCPFIHSSVMFRRKCLDTVGLYDESYKYAQDYQLWSRWVNHFKVGNLKDVIVKWRNTGTSITSTRREKQARFARRISVNFYRTQLTGIDHIEDDILIAIKDSRCSSLSKDKLAKAIFVVNKMVQTFSNIEDARIFGKNYSAETNYSSTPRYAAVISYPAGPVNGDSMSNTVKRVKTKIDNFSLSVVICTYSNVDLLRRALPIVLNDSAVKQVIIVDNCSDDVTPAYLRSIKNNKLNVITNTENKGVIKSRNQGLAIVNSEYTVVMDDDQIPSVYTFKNYKKALETFDVVGVEAQIMSFSTGLTKVGNSSNFTYVGAGGMCMSTKIWRELGLFDEIFHPAYFEDPDICMKARKKKYSLGLVTNHGIFHVNHVTLSRKNLGFDPEVAMSRNRKIFLARYSTGKVLEVECDKSVVCGKEVRIYRNVSHKIQVLFDMYGRTYKIKPGSTVRDDKFNGLRQTSGFSVDEVIKGVV